MNITLANTAPITLAIGAWLVHRTNRCTQKGTTTHTRPGIDFALQSNEIREIKATQPVRVACLQGEVWITVDGDARDVILKADQTFTVHQGQRALVMALDEACVRCTPSIG